MLSIHLYLYILLQLQNGLLIVCDNTKVTSISYLNPIKDTVKVSRWQPVVISVPEGLDRKKRISHHGGSRYSIKKITQNLLHRKSTAKPVVLHSLSHKKQRLRKSEHHKRHVAFEVYAKRINQSLNDTEEDDKNDVLKRNENMTLIPGSGPVSTSALTPGTSTSELTTTQAASTAASTTTTANEPIAPKPDVLSLSETVPSNARISEYSNQHGRTVLTKVFIIPIQESLDSVKFHDDKTEKRSDTKSKNKKKTKGKSKHHAKAKKSKKGERNKKRKSAKIKKQESIERKKRLDQKRKSKDNKKKNAAQKDHGKNRKSRKQKKETNQCRKDKTKDSHKSLQKRKEEIHSTKDAKRSQKNEEEDMDEKLKENMALCNELALLELRKILKEYQELKKEKNKYLEKKRRTDMKISHTRNYRESGSEKIKKKRLTKD